MASRKNIYLRTPKSRARVVSPNALKIRDPLKLPAPSVFFGAKTIEHKTVLLRQVAKLLKTAPFEIQLEAMQLSQALIVADPAARLQAHQILETGRETPVL